MVLFVTCLAKCEIVFNNRGVMTAAVEYIEARDIFSTLDFRRSILRLPGDKVYKLPKSYGKHKPCNTRHF